jgi:acyl-coenzyme A synthetase/AMP-(fatty) acid ligase
MSLLQSFIDYAHRKPYQAALVFAEEAVTYEELCKQASSLAGVYTKKGLKAGDAVVLALPISIALYRCLLALWWCGATVVLPDTSASISDLQISLKQLSLKGIVTNWKGRALGFCMPVVRKISLQLPFRQVANSYSASPYPLAGRDRMLITFTSGSTGHPKAIARDHSFLEGQLHSLKSLLDLQEGEQDIISLPVFALANLVSGVTSIFPDGPLAKPAQIRPDRVLDQIKKFKPDRLVMPPAIVNNFSFHPFDWPDNIQLFTGGGPIYPDLLKRLLTFIPPQSIALVYGSTEAEPIAVLSAKDIHSDDWTAMEAGSGILVGKIQTEIKVIIRDDEITVAGDEVVKGYINPNDDAQTKIRIDGEIWHRTGDAGHIDDQGRLWLLGRHAQGWRGIYPFQIEVAVRLISGIKSAAFIVIEKQPHLFYTTDKPLDFKNIERLTAVWPEIKFSEIDHIPLDKRHNSKVDYGKLKSLIAATTDSKRLHHEINPPR